MGFYAPAQLVRDAVEHGVTVLPVDVNHSGWDNGLESSPARGGGPRSGGGGLPQTLSLAEAPLHHPADGPPPRAGEDRAGEDHAIRLGLRQIDGFRGDWADAIVAHGPYVSIEDLARRASLPPRALRLLADADACGSLGQDRRAAGWEVRRTPPAQLPLFAAADAPELGVEPDAALPPMPRAEQVVADYQTMRLSLKDHPMTFLRDLFRAEGVRSSADLARMKDGRRASVAGVVLVRQRPGKGNAIFVTIEDETGITNALMWARDFEANRRAVMASRLMVLHGVVQRSEEGVIHLMTVRVDDRSDELARLSSDYAADLRPSPADALVKPVYTRGPEGRPAAPRPPHPRPTHPRDVRVLPKSRDFH
jgi:error-prone DNA polymerase